MKSLLTVALAALCLCLPSLAKAAVGFGTPHILATPTLPATDGTTLTLTAQVQVDSGYAEYLWYKDGASLSNGGRISGATTSKLVLKGIQKVDEAAYTLRVREILPGSGVADPVFSDPVDVVVHVRPVITSQPTASKAPISQDGFLSLEVGISAQSQQPLIYEWQRNNVPINSVTNPSAATANFVIPARDPMDPGTSPGVQWADAGTYRVCITNSTGVKVYSKPVIIKVASAAVLTADLPTEFYIATKAKGKLTAQAGGTPKLLYQWSIDGEGNLLKGGNAASLSIAGTPENDGKVYRVTVTNAATDAEHPAAVSGGTTIRVINKLVAPVVTGTLGMDTYQKGFTFDKGTTPVLEVLASLDNTGDLVYRWQKDGRDISDSATVTGTNTRQLVFSDLAWGDRGVYRCIVRNQVSVVTSKTFALGVNSPPVILTEPAANNVAITGGKAVFSVVAGGSGKLTYQWYRKSTDPMEADIALPKATGNKLTLTKLLRNVDKIGGDDYYCEVSNAFTASLGGGTPTPSALANLIVYDPVKIINHPQPPVGGVRIDNNLNLNVVITGDVPVVYEWYLNGKTRLLNGPRGSATIAGADTAALQIANIQPALQGNYTCIVRNAQIPGSVKYLANVTSKAAKIVVVVPPAIAQQTSASPASPVSEETSVTLSVLGLGTGPLKYQWQRRIGIAGAWENLTGKTAAKLVFPKIQLTDDAWYRCVVNNVLNEPASSDALELKVLPIPAPTVTSFTPRIGRAGEFIRVTGADFDFTNAVAFVPPVGNPIQATFVKESDTSLLVTIPVTVPLTGSKLRVTNRGSSAQSTDSAADFLRSVNFANDSNNPRILVGTNQRQIPGNNTDLFDEIYQRDVAWYSWVPPISGEYTLQVIAQSSDPIFYIMRPNPTGGGYTTVFHDTPAAITSEIYTFTVANNLVGRTFYFGVGGFNYIGGNPPPNGPFVLNFYLSALGLSLPEGGLSQAEPPAASSWKPEDSGLDIMSLVSLEDGIESVRFGGSRSQTAPSVLYSEALPAMLNSSGTVTCSFHAGLDSVGLSTDLFAWQVSADDGSPLLQVRLNSEDGSIELVGADGSSQQVAPLLISGSQQYFSIQIDPEAGLWTATMNGVPLGEALSLPEGRVFGDLTAVWYPSGGRSATMTFDRVSVQAD